MSNKDKRADEIVEETMKSIYEDISDIEKEEGCSESGKEFEEESEGVFEEGERQETEAERAYRKHKFRKKLAIIMCSIFGVLTVVYVGIALYFGSHFMFYELPDKFNQLLDDFLQLKNLSYHPTT